MESAALLEALVLLAQESGLPVQRVAGPAFEGLSPSSSGSCVVRGEVRVLLADSDPLEARIQTLAGALQAHCAVALEGRYLPPAVRACLEGIPPDP